MNIPELKAIQQEPLEMLLRQAGYDLAEDTEGKGFIVFNEEAGVHFGPYPEKPWEEALKEMIEIATEHSQKLL